MDIKDIEELLRATKFTPLDKRNTFIIVEKHCIINSSMPKVVQILTI